MKKYNNQCNIKLLFMLLLLVYISYNLYNILFSEKEGFRKKFKRKFSHITKKTKIASQDVTKTTIQKTVNLSKKTAQVANQETLKINKMLGYLFNEVTRLAKTIINVSHKLN